MLHTFAAENPDHTASYTNRTFKIISLTPFKKKKKKSDQSRRHKEEWARKNCPKTLVSLLDACTPEWQSDRLVCLSRGLHLSIYLSSGSGRG